MTFGETESFSCLTVVTEGRVAEVTLTRPDLLNRFDAELHAEFPAALRCIQDNPDIRAVVLASTGRVFSAGGDFAWMRTLNKDLDARVRSLDGGRYLLETMLDFPLPIVAALQGDTYGLGATIVLCCDAVVTHAGTAIADTHVPIGLVAGDGGCVAWPASMGMLRAKRHLLTGDPLTATEAYALGMITDLVQPDQVLDRARAIAQRLSALPPLAVQGTKRALNRYVKARAAEVIEVSFAYEAFTLGSSDLLEAIAAFRERRAGEFTAQ